jgi:hypothetical protein
MSAVLQFRIFLTVQTETYRRITSHRKGEIVAPQEASISDELLVLSVMFVSMMHEHKHRDTTVTYAYA